MIPIAIVLASVIFLLKDFIVELLFTSDFYPMRELFLWQLIGDVIKLAGWIIGYLMLAKKMTTTFIGTEVIFSLSFVVMSVFFIDIYGLAGVTYSFSLNYLLYFFSIVILTKSEWM